MKTSEQLSNLKFYIECLQPENITQYEVAKYIAEQISEIYEGYDLGTKFNKTLPVLSHIKYMNAKHVYNELLTIIDSELFTWWEAEQAATESLKCPQA